MHRARTRPHVHSCHEGACGLMDDGTEASSHRGHQQSCGLTAKKSRKSSAIACIVAVIALPLAASFTTPFHGCIAPRAARAQGRGLPFCALLARPRRLSSSGRPWHTGACRPRCTRAAGVMMQTESMADRYLRESNICRPISASKSRGPNSLCELTLLTC